MEKGEVMCANCDEYYEFNINKGICPNCETPLPFSEAGQENYNKQEEITPKVKAKKNK